MQIFYEWQKHYALLQDVCIIVPVHLFFSSILMLDLNSKISLSSKTLIFSMSFITIYSSCLVTLLDCVCWNCNISLILFSIFCSASLVKAFTFFSLKVSISFAITLYLKTLIYTIHQLFPYIFRSSVDLLKYCYKITIHHIFNVML